ncbi:transcriptional regulator with XRE-family HTH domain [Streptacidiphilus sp. MAP12-16]|uniref:helix-turn-helix domain-containing protein n=1 Tax=Streptacidiphilus sp. MAP12-16 TaxID=3156300 RepID=UPI00351372C7
MNTEPAALVRRWRMQRGLTQAELAARSATAQAVISRIESGRATPSLDALTRIAEALECSIVLDFAPHSVVDR